MHKYSVRRYGLTFLSTVHASFLLFLSPSLRVLTSFCQIVRDIYPDLDAIPTSSPQRYVIPPALVSHSLFLHRLCQISQGMTVAIAASARASAPPHTSAAPATMAGTRASTPVLNVSTTTMSPPIQKKRTIRARTRRPTRRLRRIRVHIRRRVWDAFLDTSQMGTVIKSTTTRNAVRLVFTIPHFLSSRYFLYCANASLGAKLDAVVLVRELRQRKKNCIGGFSVHGS